MYICYYAVFLTSKRIKLTKYLSTSQGQTPINYLNESSNSRTFRMIVKFKLFLFVFKIVAVNS